MFSFDSNKHEIQALNAIFFNQFLFTLYIQYILPSIKMLCLKLRHKYTNMEKNCGCTSTMSIFNKKKYKNTIAMVVFYSCSSYYK